MHSGGPQQLSFCIADQLQTVFPAASVEQLLSEDPLDEGPEGALAVDGPLASDGELPPEGPLLDDPPPPEAPPPDAPPPDAPLAPEAARAMLTVATLGTV